MGSNEPTSAIETLSQPLTLPCGLTLPNRLVKCPMQETLAEPPLYDPPIEKFQNLYTKWAHANYGLLITGQVQVDLRFFSIAGDVTCHDKALEEPYIGIWKKWAEIAQAGGTPTIVQLAHPGRMSPAGAGVRPPDMPALCPSSVPVKLGDSWLDKLALDKLLGTPKEMTLTDIDEAVANWVRGAQVAKKAGFAGCQLHGAHGFLLSEFLSPHTNRRTDEYGGTPEKRMKFLQRLVTEVRAVCPPPFCLSVKLNSGDYMEEGGLTQEEALEQVRWLCECGMVDFVEISGGNAEQKTSGLHNSLSAKSTSHAPTPSPKTRVREAFYSTFCERLSSLHPPIPIQLSGGIRTRLGAADLLSSHTCQLLGLGRTAVLEPEIPKTMFLNPSIPDDQAIALPHQIRGQWVTRVWALPKVVGGSLTIGFFYWNMRRLGNGLVVDADASIPWVMLSDGVAKLKCAVGEVVKRIETRLKGATKWLGQDMFGKVEDGKTD